MVFVHLTSHNVSNIFDNSLIKTVWKNTAVCFFAISFSWSVVKLFNLACCQVCMLSLSLLCADSALSRLFHPILFCSRMASFVRFVILLEWIWRLQVVVASNAQCLCRWSVSLIRLLACIFVRFAFMSDRRLSRLVLHFWLCAMWSVFPRS